MRSSPVTLDATGSADASAGGGYGFRLVPGGSNPDAYPVTVFLDRQPTPITIVDGAPIYLPKPLTALELRNGTPGGSWVVQVFEKCESVGAAPSTRRTQVVKLAGAVALPTSAPTLATDGFLIGPGWKAVRLQILGGACTLTKYVRSLAGTWSPAGQLTPTVGSEIVFDESVIVPGGRIAYVSDTASRTADIDVALEV